MKRNTLLRLFFLLSLLGVLHLQAGEPFRIYIASRISDQYTASNPSRQEIYAKAIDSSHFGIFPVSSRFNATLKTTFQACYNAHGIFLKVSCEEPLLRQIDFSLAAGKRDENAFSLPVVEIFLDPAFRRNYAAQFAINTAGGIFDQWGRSNSEWNHDLVNRIKPWPNGKGYTVYVCLSWKDVNADNPNEGPLFSMTPQVNTIMGFNVARERVIGGADLMQWRRTTRTFFQPAEFGALILGDTPHIEKRCLQLFTNQLLADGIAIDGGTPALQQKIINAIFNDKYTSLQKIIQTSSGSQKASLLAQTADIQKRFGETTKLSEKNSLLNQILTKISSQEKEAMKKLKKELFEAI